jgi:hypothetical protein
MRHAEGIIAELQVAVSTYEAYSCKWSILVLGLLRPVMDTVKQNASILWGLHKLCIPLGKDFIGALLQIIVIAPFHIFSQFVELVVLL